MRSGFIQASWLIFELDLSEKPNGSTDFSGFPNYRQVIVQHNSTNHFHFALQFDISFGM